MKFGIFYEHQIPRPWDANAEHRIYREALEQVELADRIGIDYAWEVEHHFLEEYSHSSAPEVFLAACSQRTKRIRLGHGIVLMPPGYNHPARVAERTAALDLVSDGRVEFGTGESASILELGGYRVDIAEKRAAWQESVEQCLNMMVMTPYPGYEGKFFSMPCRNVVPKPLQKPHPPVWVACSNRETIKLAARLGIGALTFAFVDPAEAKQWVDDYYRILKTECVPIGHAVNANIAMVTGFSVHPDAEEAKRRGEDGFKFFGYALAHHYIFGEHKPGRTDIWAGYEKARAKLPEAGAARGIGTPDQLRGSQELRGLRRRSGCLYPARRQEPARSYLPLARTVRARSVARIRCTGRGACQTKAGRACAFPCAGNDSEGENGTVGGRADSELCRARPPSGERTAAHAGAGGGASTHVGRRTDPT
jgi:alkanesulfonate monooxygenase SsuD/methylene tetrahydromethanopterin reductase-like flavin-dependent oxidoreductase (luciferase family)